MLFLASVVGYGQEDGAPKAPPVRPVFQPITDQPGLPRVLLVPEYNGTVARVMQSLGIPTNDLFAFAQPRLEEIQRPANVHFTPEGSEELAEEVAEAILARLE